METVVINLIASAFAFMCLILLVCSMIYYHLRVPKKEFDPKLGESFILSYKIRQWWTWIISPLENYFVNNHISPISITSLGLVFSIVAGLLFSQGLISLAGFSLLASAILDILDGRVARRRHISSNLGAFLDSVFDRIGEFFIFGGLLSYYAVIKFYFLTILIIILGSFLTSYCKARAESLGVKCDVGILQRPERLAVLIVMSCLGPALGYLFGFGTLFFINITLVLFAVLTTITFLQRLYHSLNLLKQ